MNVRLDTGIGANIIVSVHLGVDLNAIYASFVAFWMHVGNSGAPPSMERWVEMSEMYYAWGK